MPDRHLLVINCGSSSIKFALIAESSESPLLQGIAERLGSAEARLSWKNAAGRQQLELPAAGHREALARLLPLVQQDSGAALAGIGHRVVHGGEQFTSACLLDSASITAIRAVSPLAPLHNPACLQGIEAAMELYPALPQVAVFDTAFHQSMPEQAFRYAVPDSLYRQHGVRRYGFHGSSHRYVSHRAAQLCALPLQDSCWLVAHLGNGCSTCAVVNGESRDTSMGLTPLEGLVMGTRSGDVDPGLHGFLARTLGWDLAQVEQMLNQQSGLLGLSGLSNDMRSLEQARNQGHSGARLAIEVFCYRLAKSLAAMGCALPRLDGLVFTGGIGENSPLIRQRTIEHLQLLDLQLDPLANARCVAGTGGQIQAAGHPRVLVVPTNEERQIALDSLALLSQRS
jgi:acetate kinase